MRLRRPRRLTVAAAVGLASRAHQADDTHASQESMEAALDLALGVVDAFDAELNARAITAARAR